MVGNVAMTTRPRAYCRLLPISDLGQCGDWGQNCVRSRLVAVRVIDPTRVRLARVRICLAADREYGRTRPNFTVDAALRVVSQRSSVSATPASTWSSITSKPLPRAQAKTSEMSGLIAEYEHVPVF